MYKHNNLLLQPCVVGKVRIPFRQWLMAGSSSTVVAPVTASLLGWKGEGKGERERGREVGTNEETVGKLTVSFIPLS